MSTFRKAVAAGVAAGLAAISQGVVTDGIGHINWAVVAGAVLVAGFAVYRVPNAPAQ